MVSSQSDGLGRMALGIVNIFVIVLFSQSVSIGLQLGIMDLTTRLTLSELTLYLPRYRTQKLQKSFIKEPKFKTRYHMN